MDNCPNQKSSPSVIIEDDESIDNNKDGFDDIDLNNTQIWSLNHNISKLTDKEHLNEFQSQMIDLHNALNKELRMKKRKIDKYEIYLKETKDSVNSFLQDINKIVYDKRLEKQEGKKPLMNQDTLLKKLREKLGEFNEKFEDMLESQIILKLTEWEMNNSLLKDANNSSMLYLSSNWSAGGCLED